MLTPHVDAANPSHEGNWMQTARYLEGHLSVWRGADVLTFIDGLSTNRVLDLRKGECQQTTFTTTTAKVIDRVALFHMGDFVACVSHAPFWDALHAHVSPRILGQDVSIFDASANNEFYVRFGDDDSTRGVHSTNDGVTIGHLEGGYDLIVATVGKHVESEINLDSFHAWRIERCVPWPGYEITAKHHALACGLSEDVHPSKGCYIGQEGLTRMISRNKQGRTLSVVANEEVQPSDITTKGASRSLAIIRV